MPYKAFMSYSHAADAKLAPALQSALHSFAKPWYRLRSIRVFRDITNLAANPALWPSIESALSESEYFLLLASPQAARSPWVEREIKWWLQNRSVEKMLILLTDGELVWDRTTNDYNWEQTTALPGGVRSQFKDEPLYVDLRWAKTEDKLSLRHSRFRSAVLDIAAPLYGKDKDELDGEDVRQHRRNKRWAWSAGVALSIATLFAVVGAIIAFQQREVAVKQREVVVKQREVAETQRNLASSRQLATQAELVGNQQPNLLPQSVLLATTAMQLTPTFTADQALYQSLALLGPQPIAERSYRGLNDLVLSPHGQYVVQLPYDGPAVVEETVSGKTITSLSNVSPDNEPLPAVRQVSFSADDKRIATLSSLGISAFVWELPSGRELFRTPANRGAIITAVLSADGNSLATGHTDGLVSLWNIATGDEILSLSHADPPYLIRFSPDGKYLAMSSSHGVFYGPASIAVVRLWDVEKNQEIAQLQHASAVTHVTFSPNGKYLATTSRVGEEQEKQARIGRVTVWETATGKEVTNVRHAEAVNIIAFTSNSTYLLTGSADGTARLWDVVSGQEQLRVDHGSTVELVEVLPVEDVSYVITAGRDSTVRVWGLHVPVLEWLRLMESPNIVALAHAAEGQYLATISHDVKADVSVPPEQHMRDVRVWTVASLKEKLRLEHEHVVGGVHFSPDGRYLATFDFQKPTSKLIPKTAETDASFEYADLGSGSVNVWEVSTRKRLTHLQHPGTVMAIDYDPTGKYLATACVDGIVRVWEALSGQEVAHLKHDGWVYELAFSPDGRYVATSSGGPELLEGKQGRGLATIWEWRTGQASGHLQSDNVITALAFSSDGQFLAAGGYDGIVHTLRAADAQAVQQLRHDNPIWALAFSPDGRYVATASGEAISEDSPLQKGATTLWNVDDGKKTVLREHQSWTMSVAFSPNGKYLASIDQNGLVGVWATADGREIATMKYDEFVAEAKVRFSPADSNYLVTAFGNTAYIWEVSTGKEVARREHARGYLWDAAFSPDGTYLATASTDTTAGLWLWRPEDLIAEACARLPRNLTRAEWRQYVGEEVAYHATCANLATLGD